MDSEGEHCKGENYEIKNEPDVDCEDENRELNMNLLWIVKVNIVKVRITK